MASSSVVDTASSVTVAPVEVTLEQFIQDEDEWTQNAASQLTRCYKERIMAILRKEKHYPVERANEIANGMIDDGNELMDNAECEDDDDDESTDKANGIMYEYEDLQKELLYKCFLLIKAPRDKKRLPIAQDDQNRKWQYDNFCELHPALRQDAELKSEKVMCDVRTYSVLASETLNFFEKYSSRALDAVVIFNGHGGPDGFILQGSGDDVEKIPLDTYLQYVRDVSVSTRAKACMDLPMKVQLIYAQCYGHLHLESSDFNFNIVHFTDDEMRTTPYILKRDPLTRMYLDSSHTELEKFAKKEDENFDKERETSFYDDQNKAYQSIQRERSKASISESSIGTKLSGANIESGVLHRNDRSATYESVSESSGLDDDVAESNDDEPGVTFALELEDTVYSTDTGVISTAQATSSNITQLSSREDEDNCNKPVIALETDEDTVDSYTETNVRSTTQATTSIIRQTSRDVGVNEVEESNKNHGDKADFELKNDGDNVVICSENKTMSTSQATTGVKTLAISDVDDNNVEDSNVDHGDKTLSKIENNEDTVDSYTKKKSVVPTIQVTSGIIAQPGSELDGHAVDESNEDHCANAVSKLKRDDDIAAVDSYAAKGAVCTTQAIGGISITPRSSDEEFKMTDSPSCPGILVDQRETVSADIVPSLDSLHISSPIEQAMSTTGHIPKDDTVIPPGEDENGNLSNAFDIKGLQNPVACTDQADDDNDDNVAFCTENSTMEATNGVKALVISDVDHNDVIDSNVIHDDVKDSDSDHDDKALSYDNDEDTVDSYTEKKSVVPIIQVTSGIIAQPSSELDGHAVDESNEDHCANAVSKLTRDGDIIASVDSYREKGAVCTTHAIGGNSKMQRCSDEEVKMTESPSCSGILLDQRRTVSADILGSLDSLQISTPIEQAMSTSDHTPTDETAIPPGKDENGNLSDAVDTVAFTDQDSMKENRPLLSSPELPEADKCNEPVQENID